VAQLLPGDPSAMWQRKGGKMSRIIWNPGRGGGQKKKEKTAYRVLPVRKKYEVQGRK